MPGLLRGEEVPVETGQVVGVPGQRGQRRVLLRGDRRGGGHRLEESQLRHQEESGDIERGDDEAPDLVPQVVNVRREYAVQGLDEHGDHRDQ